MKYKVILPLVVVVIVVPLYAQRRFEWVIHPTFDKADPFVNGVAFVVKGDSVHFIDQTGKRLHSYLKVDVGSFFDDMAVIVVNGKRGFVDRSGNIVIKPQYDHVTDFAEGLSMILTKNKMGAIDKQGRVVIPATYFALLAPTEGLIAAQSNTDKKWGFIDTKGKVVVPFKYDDVKNAPGVMPFKNGLATAVLQGKIGYIDKTGKTVIPHKFDQADDFQGDLAKVLVKSKWGFIDKTGKFVIQPTYESYPSGFSDGLMYVNVSKTDVPQYGYFDTSGKVVIPAKYSWAESFNDGIAKVQIGDQVLYINKAGETVDPPMPKRNSIYPALDEVGEPSDGLRAAKKNGKWGYVKAREN